MAISIKQFVLLALQDNMTRKSLYTVFQGIYDRLSSQTLTTPGLTIKAATNPTVKAATAFYAVAGGTLITKGANTDMAALSGTVTNAKFNVFCFFVDSAGTLTSAMGTEGATLAAVRFPQSTSLNYTGKAMVGFVIINPTGTGNFVGGTTNLDDGTVVPNAVYVNTLGAVDPSATLTV